MQRRIIKLILEEKTSKRADKNDLNEFKYEVSNVKQLKKRRNAIIEYSGFAPIRVYPY